MMMTSSKKGINVFDTCVWWAKENELPLHEMLQLRSNRPKASEVLIWNLFFPSEVYEH